MKKLFIIILSMLLFTLPLSAWSLFSQAPSRPECVTDELNEILEDGKFERDAEQINTLTLNFSLAERHSFCPKPWSSTKTGYFVAVSAAS